MEKIFAWVLERKDYEKLQLNDYFYSRPEIIVPIKTIMRDLAWSRYRVLTTYELLVADLVKLQSNQPKPFYYDDELKAIIVNHNVILERYILQKNYLDKSIVWQYLGELLAEQIVSLEDFAKRYLTSVPVVRAAKQLVEHHLADLDLHISKDNRLIGSENTIRSFYFGIVRIIKGPLMLATPGQQFDRIVDELFVRLEKRINNSLRQTNVLKLKLIISIWFLRIQKGNFLQNRDVDYTFAHDVDSLYQPVVEITGELIANQHIQLLEARYLTAALYASGVVSDGKINIFDSTAQRKLLALRSVLQESYHDFFKADFSLKQLETLDEMLFAAHLRLLFFPYARLISDNGGGSVIKSLPIQSTFVEYVIKRIAVLSEDTAVSSYLPVLFNDYLVTFTYIIDEKVLPVVKVVLDFTDNQAMARLLHKQISNIQGLNIEIEKYLNEATDIYISDQMLTWDKAIPAFLWASLPSDYAFSRFLNQVVEITKDKFVAE